MMWHRVEGTARYIVDADTLTIWCEGSNGVQDWTANFRVRRVKCHGVRVNKADLAEARRVLSQIHDLLPGRRIVVAGFSRGGAIASILWHIMWHEHNKYATVLLWAPKRSGVVPKNERADAYRGDVVPLLPPWYPSHKIVRKGKRQWPWDAHIASAKEAAHWREKVDRNGPKR